MTTDLLTAELVSVGDLKYNADPDWDSNFQLLTQRTQYQTASSGATTFSGSIEVLGSIVVTTLTNPSSSFTSSVTITGNLVAPQGTSTMVSGSSTLYVGLSLLSPSTVASSLNMLWGKSNTTLNSGIISWDVTNTRGAIGLSGSNFFTVSSTAVNLQGIVKSSLGGYYGSVLNTNSISFSLSAGSVSTAVTTIPTTNIREVYITVRGFNFTTTSGDPPALQFGEGVNYLYLVGGYIGVSEGNTKLRPWKDSVGIDLYDQITQNQTYTTTVKLSLIGIVNSRQTWSVWLQGACEQTDVTYCVGNGLVVFDTSVITKLTSVRVKNIAGNCTGYLSVSYL